MAQLNCLTFNLLLSYSDEKRPGRPAVTKTMPVNFQSTQPANITIQSPPPQLSHGDLVALALLDTNSNTNSNTSAAGPENSL